jgi:hypothetical protein
MSLGGVRHRALGEELAETLEDVTEGGIGSRVVLVGVPAGWGRSAVLQQFAAVAGADDSPIRLVARIDGNLPPGRAVQALELQQALEALAREPWLVRRLGLDKRSGRVVLGLGVAGLMASGPAEAAGLLVASLAATAAGSAWDDSPAGEAGGVARAARYLARLSGQVPVVVIIDDADCLDPGLALALIRGLAGRVDGQVLVVAAAAPGTELAKALTQDPGYDLAARVQRAEADPSMRYADRVALAAELLPGLPAAGIERLARRTATFAEVFAAASTGRLAELGPETATSDTVAVVDAVTDTVLEQTRPSPEAVMLAWAGGALHDRQASAALRVRGAARQEDDPHVVAAGSLLRLAEPAAGLRAAGSALPVAVRQQMAAAVLGVATALAGDPSAGLVDLVVARQAVHHVRGDLADRSGLPRVQIALIRSLEKLGDRGAAYDVATAALAELKDLPPEDQDTGQRQELLTAALRLARTRPGRDPDNDPVAAEAVELAASGGALVRPEARVWAAADLLHRPGRRQDGLRLAREVIGDLEARHIHGELASRWRLLLAFHVGQAGDTVLAKRLLAPLISAGPAGQQDAADAVLRAIGGPHADTHLQIILLEDEVARTPAGADDDLLRLHHALAADYHLLGNYHAALHHGCQELPLRRRIQGDDHPNTLTTRNNVAVWTGQTGDRARALRLSRELLPDRIRVLGPDHRDTMSTRNVIAFRTGDTGDAAGALRLFRELLDDQVRVLGRDHPDTMTTRNNFAYWTGETGDVAGALRLFRELLPDRIRVLGPDDPVTLSTRNNIAVWTAETGDVAGALRLFRELLDDHVRVLGRDHPNTMATRNNIAQWTGVTRDVAGALRLFRELLDDQVPVLGRDHPDTMTTRNNIAGWTAETGDVAEALRLFREVLDDQVRVLGRDHPDTMNTRNNIAHWTEALAVNTQVLDGSRSGDSANADPPAQGACSSLPEQTPETE